MGNAMIWCGVDPGIDGALALILEDLEVRFVDIPSRLKSTRNKRREVDAATLANTVRDLGLRHVVAVLELLHARAGSAIQHQGQMMDTNGAIRAALQIAGWQIERVDPKRWKSFYGLGSNKEASRATAARLYPSAADQLGRAKDHNRAEALLIAHWAMRTKDTRR